MKIIFSLCFLLILNFESRCQTNDSLRIQLNKVMTDLEFIKSNMDKSHRQFQVGSAMFCVAGSAAVFGIVFMNTDNTQLGKVVLTGAGILGFAAAIVMIDSHKYIGRIGGWQFQVKSGY